MAPTPTVCTPFGCGPVKSGLTSSVVRDELDVALFSCARKRERVVEHPGVCVQRIARFSRAGCLEEVMADDAGSYVDNLVMLTKPKPVLDGVVRLTAQLGGNSHVVASVAKSGVSPDTANK